MIQSFRCKDTQAVFEGQRVRRFVAIAHVLQRKLIMLEQAVVLDDLRSPPGNRLQGLRGDRLGQHSVRINDQFRLCFRWSAEGPEDVEVVDYHS